jgi:hypothetical protein
MIAATTGRTLGATQANRPHRSRTTNAPQQSTSAPEKPVTRTNGAGEPLDRGDPVIAERGLLGLVGDGVERRDQPGGAKPDGAAQLDQERTVAGRGGECLWRVGDLWRGQWAGQPHLPGPERDAVRHGRLPRKLGLSAEQGTRPLDSIVDVDGEVQPTEGEVRGGEHVRLAGQSDAQAIEYLGGIRPHAAA